MKRRASSSESDNRGGQSNRKEPAESVDNIRNKPAHVYDNITRRLLRLSITLALTSFIGLIVRYAVQEFDPAASTITVTTTTTAAGAGSRSRDVASFNFKVSKNFLERILEFVEESISIAAAIIPLGFPLCTLFNRYFAKLRLGGSSQFEVRTNLVLGMIPKYFVIGDMQACCQTSQPNRLRPLVRDTIFHLIKAHLKPKLIVEDSYDEARRLGIRIGLIKRDHHQLAVIKSVDLLKLITDCRGDIKQGKVRYLLSKMKIMSQATPADKSLLIYLMKHCESQPNENLAYLGHSFTDPEAMSLADCAITFADCDDDDVKRAAQVLIKSQSQSFTDLYLFLVVCLLHSNILQSFALYQISASVSACIYRFLSITVFQEQLISRSQFTLLVLIQQVFAIIALMTKWLASLPQAPLKISPAEMSHAATEDSFAADSATSGHLSSGASRAVNRSQQPVASISGSSAEQQSSANGHRTSTQMRRMDDEDRVVDNDENSNDDDDDDDDDTLNSSSSLENHFGDSEERKRRRRRRRSAQPPAEHYSSRHHRKRRSQAPGPIHLSGADLDLAVINSKVANTYKQTFHNTSFIDDVTYRLAKLHIAYQLLVMIIIMIFGEFASDLFRCKWSKELIHH